MSELPAPLDPGTDHSATTCLACGAQQHLQTCPASNTGATDLMVEHLDTGTVRTWMVSGIRHNLTPARRARYTAQLPLLHWVRPVDKPELPMSAGLLVNGMLAEMGIGAHVAAIGYSAAACVPVADCRCRDWWRCRCDFPGHPFRYAAMDFWPDYGLLAFKVRYQRGWSLMWWLDTGLGGVYIAEDHTPIDGAPPKPITRRCYLGWCDTCPTAITTAPAGAAATCQCPCHRGEHS